MRKSLVVAFLVACAAIAGCTKEPPSTEPAVLKSVAILAADNADLISEDINLEVAESMTARVKGGPKGKTVVLSLTAGENDVIKANNTEVAGGKVSVTEYPVDITVTNSKSGLSAAYELKIGKILGITVAPVLQYAEANAEAGMANDINMAVSKEGTPYFSYLRKATVDGTTDKYNKLSVVKLNGAAMEKVGDYGFTDGSARAAATPITLGFTSDNKPIVMFKGAQVANLISVMQYSGSKWEFVGGEAGATTKFTSSYGAPQFYINPTSKQPGFFYTNSVGSTDANYRNYCEATYTGSAWQQNYSSLASFPKYGAKGGSDGMFYRGVTCNTSNAAYLVTSCNLYGYYVYKMTSAGWTAVVENFCPQDEEYGIPTNLSVKADGAGNVYVFAASSKTAKMQVYKLNEEKKTLETYGTQFTCTAASAGSIKEQAAFAVAADGSMVCVLDGKFYALNKNKQWELVADLAITGTVKSDYFMDYTGADTGVFAIMVQDADKKNKIHVYSFRPEDDDLQ